MRAASRSLLSASCSLLSALHSFREKFKKSDFYSTISIINLQSSILPSLFTFYELRFTALFVSFSFRGTNSTHGWGLRP
jgi:hypothetical protein